VDGRFDGLWAVHHLGAYWGAVLFVRRVDGARAEPIDSPEPARRREIVLGEMANGYTSVSPQGRQGAGPGGVAWFWSCSVGLWARIKVE